MLRQEIQQRIAITKQFVGESCVTEEIRADFQTGKFNRLIEKAQEEFAQGKAIEL